MTTGCLRHRLLLVSSHSCHESEFLEALRWATTQQPALHFESVVLVHGTCCGFFGGAQLARSHTIVFVSGVHLAPSANTSSRVRHCSNPGQPPVRSRTIWLVSAASCNPGENGQIKHRHRGALLVNGASLGLPNIFLFVFCWSAQKILEAILRLVPRRYGSSAR